MITSERGPLPALLSACILIVYDVPGFNLSIVTNFELGATDKIAVKKIKLCEQIKDSYE